MKSKSPKTTPKTTPEARPKAAEARPPQRETDLYPPLKAWLEAAGYTVHGEVGGCDLAARRGDELVLIEIKLAVNLDLVLQVVRRQEATAAVYAAVPPPRAAGKRWRELTRLLKRLEVGLVLVSPKSGRVEVAFHPVRPERRVRKSVTRALLTEMAGRSRDLNLGGCTRRPLMTAYREEALQVAETLDGLGPTSPKDLRSRGTSPKTGDILLHNHYGWFERVARGVYALTNAGREALGRHRELVGTVTKNTA